MGSDLPIRERVPMAPLSTLDVGGPARYYLHARDLETVTAGLRWAAQREVPVFVLGGGSNIVVGDEGFGGLVLHVVLRGLAFTARDGTAEVNAGAGEPWDDLVAATVERGWAGLECLSGIPGLVGATPIQNVGAYGQDVSETIVRVSVLDRASGEAMTLSNEECGFGYRDSRFKRQDRGRFVITGVSYRLRPAGPPAVRYPELERYLDVPRRSPSLAEVRAAVLEVRRRKSMIIEPSDANRRSVGSFFVNPVVAPGTAEHVREVVRGLAESYRADQMPAFPCPDGRVKLSAAWLIERAGLARGWGRGAVGISTKHTLAIVNRGGANAGEVIALAREVRERVRQAFGITLMPEPVLVNLEL